MRNGVYSEAVKINGSKKRYLKLIGNPGKPAQGRARGRGNMQNGIFVNEADEVTSTASWPATTSANGFFVTNVNGYTMNHLIAAQTGVYGLYAFNTIGGRMSTRRGTTSTTAPSTSGRRRRRTSRSRRSCANVDGWGSPIGFSATNMRYVTITKSRFYNNALGIVPNALDGRSSRRRRATRSSTTTSS